ADPRAGTPAGRKARRPALLGAGGARGRDRRGAAGDAPPLGRVGPEPGGGRRGRGEGERAAEGVQPRPRAEAALPPRLLRVLLRRRRLELVGGRGPQPGADLHVATPE